MNPFSWSVMRLKSDCMFFHNLRKGIFFGTPSSFLFRDLPTQDARCDRNRWHVLAKPFLTD